MGRRHHQGHSLSARALRRAKRAPRAEAQRFPIFPRPRARDRRALLAGTALASTLVLGMMVAPRPAHAVGCVTPPGDAIYVQADNSIVCINTETRPAEPVTAVPASPASVAIFLQTPENPGSVGPYSIYLNNSGALTTGPASTGSLYGIYTNSGNDLSPITILNSGDVTLNTTESGTLAAGIRARSFGDQSSIFIQNSGDLSLSADEQAFGIRADTEGVASAITVENDGDIAATSATGGAAGISALTTCCYAPIAITNRGDVAASAFGDARGIDANTIAVYSDITIENSGGLVASARFFAYGIYTETNQTDSDISINNSGAARVTASVGSAFGLRAHTYGEQSSIAIENSGALQVTGNDATGIYAVTACCDAPISIVNSGDLNVEGRFTAAGIFASTAGPASPIAIYNSGDITVVGTAPYALSNGIRVQSFGPESNIAIINKGSVNAGVYAIDAFSLFSDIAINNSGPLKAGVDGIYASGIYGHIAIVNDGPIEANYHGIHAGDCQGPFCFTGDVAIANTGPINAGQIGILAITFASDGSNPYGGAAGDGGNIAIVNQGTVEGAFAGIVATVAGNNGTLTIVNEGTVNGGATGIFAETGIETFIPCGCSYGLPIFNPSGYGNNSPITIDNSGDIVAGTGILAETFGNASSNGSNAGIVIRNAADIVSDGVVNAGAIYTATLGNAAGDHSNVGIAIDNTGDLTAVRGGIVAGIFGDASGAGSNAGIAIKNAGGINALYGIYTVTKGNANGDGSNVGIDINNSGAITAGAAGILARVYGSANGASSNASIHIENSGSVFGGTAAGIYAYGNTATIIVNSGYVSGASLLAINTNGAGNATIYNSGLVTGFIVLDADDTFINQAGGVFETKVTSAFGPGSDLFRNEQGGTVLAATDPNKSEYSSFVELERFENKGLISLQDGAVGDTFRISNTVGGTDLDFVASGQSTLAIDAFLGGPNSTADQFIIDGAISGATKVKVNNTNTGPGVFNKEGIPVIFVNGATPKGDEFFLGNPIDTGFFNYDLFFRPTGSGIFELRSFVGPGAFVLPQLITASQDIWHETSDTWFDRTADLRVLLNGGAASTAYDPNARYAEGTPASGNITPAVWARGSGNWLDRDVTANVTAYGRDYKYDLNRDLETVDFQMGLDLGKRGLLAENDILVFGALGGFVHADLDYDANPRAFDYQGGQVGGYATYLRGGLFVDTLLNVHLMEIDTGRSLGFPSSLDATTVGVRTDSGYRFGSFNGGAFIEPLATIAVDWADIDGFSLGGNKVSFDDDANVRGRLGLRVGTSMQLWTGTTMEPFVIGSLWGNLSDDNQATLVSTGTTFILKDDLEDVWGEVSAGVNFFNPSANTSVFAKLDVTFGDNIDGVGGKAGMRVSW